MGPVAWAGFDGILGVRFTGCDSSPGMETRPDEGPDMLRCVGEAKAASGGWISVGSFGPEEGFGGTSATGV